MPPLGLPDHTPVSAEALRALAERHHVSVQQVERLPDTGIFNAVYRLGDGLILRIPRNHPAFTDAIHTEAVAVPAARAAGVRTPRLLLVDDTRDVLPVPFAVYERVHGEALESLHLPPAATPDVWRELGRDLAVTHTRGAVGRRRGPPQAE